jgi:uncharacterized membrane protein (DUF106 family)
MGVGMGMSSKAIHNVEETNTDSALLPKEKTHHHLLLIFIISIIIAIIFISSAFCRWYVLCLA